MIDLLICSRRWRPLAMPFAVAAGLSGLWALALAGPAAALPSNCPQSGLVVTCTFSFTNGQQTFTVPAGVNVVDIGAVGAPGGAGQNGEPGGTGAAVSGNLAVTGGETLYVEVGGPGGSAQNGSGGFNGGAYGSTDGGGGGGASDVRTASLSAGLHPDTRVVVAGGGGGAGEPGFLVDGTPLAGATGGAAGEPGNPGANATASGFGSAGGGGGGQPGSPSHGGAGGSGGACSPSCGHGAGTTGATGTLGQGGAGAEVENVGGGGGGGLYGGGGGGGGSELANGGEFESGSGGGGGGGSSLGGSVTPNVDNLPPEVIIAYHVSSLGSVATSKSQCEHGGWQHLTDNNGNPFKNHGDCVSFVASGGKNPASG